MNDNIIDFTKYENIGPVEDVIERVIEMHPEIETIVCIIAHKNGDTRSLFASNKTQTNPLITAVGLLEVGKAVLMDSED